MPTPSHALAGELMLRAEERARKKSSQSHAEEAECGCKVTATWFSRNSRSIHFDLCSEHTPPKQARATAAQ